MRTYVKGLIPTNPDLTDRRYINDIDKASPGISGFLKDGEVRELIGEYRKSKKDSIRSKLIYTFGRYVVSIAKNYQSQGLPLADLISEGMIGLITSIDGFDLSNDTQFMTYANVVISRQMREALDQFNLPVKVPKNIRNQHRKVKTVTEEMQLKGIAEGDIQEKFIDNPINFAYYINPGLFSKVSVGAQSEDDEFGNDESTMFISDDEPDAKLNKQDLSKDISRIFKTRLTKIESRVLKLFFGIGRPYRIVSTADLGKRLGMSGERARQIKESGLQKLRSDDCKNILGKYL